MRRKMERRDVHLHGERRDAGEAGPGGDGELRARSQRESAFDGDALETEAGNYETQDRMLTCAEASFAYTANEETLTRTEPAGTTSYCGNKGAPTGRDT